MKLNRKEKELIARWFKSIERPDIDGYCGHFWIPEDIMKVYRKLYPKDWN